MGLSAILAVTVLNHGLERTRMLVTQPLNMI